jgi:hypothetical protein
MLNSSGSYFNKVIITYIYIYIYIYIKMCVCKVQKGRHIRKMRQFFKCLSDLKLNV